MRDIQNLWHFFLGSACLFEIFRRLINTSIRQRRRWEKAKEQIQNFFVFPILLWTVLPEQRIFPILFPVSIRLYASGSIRQSKSYGIRQSSAALRLNSSYSAVARQLFIHRNTVLYRMERVLELYPLQLEDPEQQEYLLISFRLKRLKDSCKYPFDSTENTENSAL